jgi:hypothetical protein
MKQSCGTTALLRLQGLNVHSSRCEMPPGNADKSGMQVFAVATSVANIRTYHAELQLWSSFAMP